MRILPDENLDWWLRRDLPLHHVESVSQLGWAGTQNGDLFTLAVEAGSEAFITMDGNLPHQQNIARYPVAVVALRAISNRLADTRPLMPELIATLPRLQPGALTFVPALSSRSFLRQR